MKINFYEQAFLRLERKIERLEKEKHYPFNQCPYYAYCLMFECPYIQLENRYFEKGL